MAGAVSEESEVGRSVEGNSSGHRSSQSGEALAEWRSSEQVENGTPSTSPPYWDTDDEEDGGPKPSELYGKYTWKIEKFSQLNKRELRSNAFEVGGYKWYILIYPQGCDVCNHLSLFLCVANHDKLLPGWSHFAQFTIAVVNKDPKKSKYSDTLHRFWKKEHDWGWKKFMELSKVLDGFIDVDTLIIKAQVQVIREKVDRPFRCLDCQYRRELVRVYLTNVEQICRRFVEERRSKLGKLIDDKARWSSFCAFWLGIDQNARCRMSRGKTDAILRVVVKHFFIEKEVTSTLVMDSLYSGLKALEGQMKCNKGRARLLDSEEMTAPIVRVEKDMFILVDDVLLLLERAAMEPLPPKDEKGPQNRTKDGSSGDDFNRDSIERDERRLTELGRRTVEIFVLAHIFSNKIEVAYQEAVALKRQEELIREEEAAWQMETEQKARRGTTEKEKKSKKKQAKQKRNNRKGKDRGKEEIRADMAAQDNQEEEGNPSDEKKDSLSDIVQPMLEKPDILEDVSDVSDSVDGVTELVPQSCLADREASPIQWDTDTSEIPLPTEANRSGIGGVPSSVQLVLSDKKCRSSPSPSPMDDSSSTCSTDSIPPVRMNGPHKGNAFLTTYRLQKSRGKGQTCNASCEGNNWVNQTEGRLSGPAADVVDPSDASGSSRPGKSESGSGVVKKEEEVVSLHKKAAISDQIDTERPVKEKTSVAPSSPQSPHVKLPSSIPHKSDNNQSGAIKDLSLVKKVILKSTHQTEKVVPVIPSSQIVASSKVDTQKAIATKPTEKPIQQLLPVMSRPSSAPLIPGAKPTVAPIVSMVQTAPLLARSMSAAGRLGPDPSSATHSYGPPQSYRNAIIGNNHVSATSAGFTTHPNSPILGGNNNTNNPSSPHSSASLMVSARMYIPQNSERLDPNSVKLSAVNPPPRNPSPAYSQASAPMFIPQIPEMSDPNTVKSSYPFGMVSPLHCCSPLRSSSQSFVPYKQLVHSGASEHLSQVLVDEFPHLDIINDLLDDEQHGMVNEPSTSSMNGGPRLLTRQFSLPGEIGMSGEMGSTNSSCRFERTHSYHDGGFERGYDHPSSSGQFENVMDYIPQGSPLPYMNGQIDGLIHNQWQIGSDLSVLGTRRSEYDGHPYFNPEYTNMVCGVNGYTIFRPSNGH